MDAIRNLSALLSNTASSDNIYMTQELFSQLASIHVALELFNLDAEIQKTNPSFTLVRDVEPTVREITNALHEYRSNFESSNVGKMQENEVRRLHQWGINKLKCFIDQLNPFAAKAQKDVDDYSDKIGTTDRFTGYRNMLNRGTRDAFRLGMTSSARDHGTAEGYNYTLEPAMSSQRIDKSFPQRGGNGCSSNEISNRCVQRGVLPGNLEEMEKRPKNMIKLDVTKEGRTPAEEAGLNIVFPGSTEYHDRYIPPINTKDASPFAINPLQDFERQFGRRVAIDPWHIPESEYEFRYKFPMPDCDKRLPWDRK